MRYYIINIIILLNLSFFVVELLHMFNNIDLTLIFVSFFCFYFLFYFLSFTFNNYYITYIYNFFFKYLYIFFLLKKNIKVLFNVSKNNFKFYYYILYILKYYLYNKSLNSLFFLEYIKSNFIFNLFKSGINIKKSKVLLLDNLNYLNNNRNIFFF